MKKQTTKLPNTLSRMEVEHFLGKAIEEIKSLRLVIRNLQPKADAYDVLATTINLIPKPSQGYGIDVAWELQRALDDLSKREP